MKIKEFWEKVHYWSFNPYWKTDWNLEGIRNIEGIKYKLTRLCIRKRKLFCFNAKISSTVMFHLSTKIFSDSAVMVLPHRALSLKPVKHSHTSGNDSSDDMYKALCGL